MTTFRTATEEELVEILSWAAAEGWNPGHEDAAAFYQADPEGFFVADRDGILEAAISVVNHTEDYAFLGLYIVRPDKRGQGIGLGLWSHAMAHADKRTVGLDGVEDQQANYAASGFAHAGSTTRYSGAIPAGNHDSIRPAHPKDTPTLIATEAAASGVEKTTYLSAWFTPAETRQTFVLADGDRISGLCTVRRCAEGSKIGPLVAATHAQARALLETAAAWSGTEVIVDVPRSAGPLTTLCKNAGMTPSFQTARMYRGPFDPPQADFYSVATLELG